MAYPQYWSHTMQVDRRTGKVRRPETEVLPLSHATNLGNVHIAHTVLTWRRAVRCVLVSDRSPYDMANLLFGGPDKQSAPTIDCHDGTKLQDFEFTCEITLLPSAMPNSKARYNVSLTFDGKHDESNPATTVTLSSTRLKASFLSSALMGNMAKWVGLLLLN